MRYEADVVIIGGGITAAMVAQKLSELRPAWSVIVVEAGKRLFDFENRFDYRERSLDYGENQWPGDFVADQSARGVDLANDGGRRIGAALGRRVQSILRRRHAAEVDVRPRGGLADRVEGARSALLRGRAAPRRVRRAESAAGGLAQRAVPDAGDADDLEPDPAQGVGGAERHQVLDDAAGEEHGGRLRRPRPLPPLQHVRDLPDRRALLARLDVQAAVDSKEDPAPRPDARAQARAGRRQQSHRGRHRRARGRHGRQRRVSSAAVRPRVRLLLEPASAAAQRQQPLPERPRELVRSRRPLHDRPPRVLRRRSIWT